VLCLGIETSSRRGSVALVKDGVLLSRAEHHELNAHAEQLRPLLERVLAEAKVDKRDIERVAVGIGPGSFTGLRVGIAFAQGIALGLGVPCVGVGSLAAMAAAVDAANLGTRVALLDARRNEVFVATYSPDGGELSPPIAIERALVARHVSALGEPRVVVGEIGTSLGIASFASLLSDLPDAQVVAELGARMVPEQARPEPEYVRDAGATPQALPPSPFVVDHVE
jgi:tRNA threonylcarbamoyl adenosine modification protein YeaZ